MQGTGNREQGTSSASEAKRERRPEVGQQGTREAAALKKPTFRGVRRGRCPRRKAESRQEIGNVTLHGVLTELEMLRDRRVALALWHEPQNLELTRRHVRVPVRLLRG